MLTIEKTRPVFTQAVVRMLRYSDGVEIYIVPRASVRNPRETRAVVGILAKPRDDSSVKAPQVTASLASLKDSPREIRSAWLSKAIPLLVSIVDDLKRRGIETELL